VNKHYYVDGLLIVLYGLRFEGQDGAYGDSGLHMHYCTSEGLGLEIFPDETRWIE
jgi:hypothetical protein